MTAHTIAGAEIRNSKLGWLSPVVDGWIEVVQKYSKRFDGEDAIYWYNERPNIGALAAAAWTSGLIAIEEYKNFKGEKQTDKAEGRTDLYIADRNGKYDAVIEAKLQWWPDEALEPKIAAACKDAKLNHDTSLRLGCVFSVPKWVAKTYQRTTVADALNLFKKNKSDLVAWCFPGVANQLRPTNQYRKFVYPGVIMTMRIAAP